MFFFRNEKGYIFYLALLAMVPPIATDMYLPAMPSIAEGWGVGDDMVALSMVFWFAAFSVSLLVVGAMSDKFGRRPILLGGLGAFAVSSILCGLSQNVEQLIFFRVLQGLSAAAPSGMCMAICRDRFEGVQRQHALAYIGIILSVVPMLAPSVGALFLEVASWRAIFIMQGLVITGTFFISLGYEETAQELFAGPLRHVYARYGALLKNRSYLLATILMGLFVGPFYGFLAFSQKAYMTLFGQSKQVFGLFFAFNAGMSVLGAFASTRLVKKHFRPGVMTTCLIGGCIAGGMLLACGASGAYAFAAGMGLFSFFAGMSRPMSNHLILEQVDRDIGSASAGIIFYQFVVGAICMAVVTADTAHPFFVFGSMTLLMTGVVLLGWFPLLAHLRKHNRVPS